VIIATIYRWSDAARPKEGVQEVLKRYADLGEGPGLLAHYVFTDGTGGIVISEGDDAAFGYKVGLALGEFFDDVETRVVLPLEEALPIVMEYAGS
jgi:hypothetical protein